MPAPVIGTIGTQQILINSNYRQTVQITNAPTAVRVLGLIYPFNYNWTPATGTLELLGNPTRALEGTWTIQASNADGSAEAVEIPYAVIPLRPVINADDLAEATITRGQVFEKIVRIDNAVSPKVEGELIGLDHTGGDAGVRIFGTVPTDANFTVRSGVFTITAPYPLGDVTGELPWQFPPSAPFPPLQLMANGAQGGGRVRLRWLAPLDDGGGDIIRYEYSRDGGARQSTGSTSLEFFDTGLTNLDTHTYQLFAVNANGVSQGSNIVTVTVRVSITVPTVPRDFAVAPGNAEVTGSWTAPIDDGGDEITDYEYQRDGGTWESAGLSGTFTDTGLNNGQTYRYKMRAVNPQGNSVETAEVSVTPRTTPDAPTITGTGGAGEATITITAPTETGGLPILYYQYRVGVSGTWTDIPGGATVTSYTIPFLDAGTLMIYARAVTGIADETERYASVASNVVSVTVTERVVSPPSACRSLGVRFTLPSGSQLIVSQFFWAAPLSLGMSGPNTAATFNRYEWRSSSQATWQNNGTSSQVSIIRITNSGERWLEVRAVNNNPSPNDVGPAARITYSDGRWS